MPARITLTATRGALKGQSFVFAKAGAWILGRGSDCELRFPCDWAHWRVSRHHCQLVIDPPAVCVRDLGSLNGTFVNGDLIGRRDQPCDAGGVDGVMHELHDGDELALGDAAFLVTISETATGDVADWPSTLLAPTRGAAPCRAVVKQSGTCLRVEVGT